MMQAFKIYTQCRPSDDLIDLKHRPYIKPKKRGWKKIIMKLAYPVNFLKTDLK